MRAATASASAASATSGMLMMNSSPPRRATVSSSRRAAVRRADDRGQQHVADRVAERIVDVLEAVEIEKQHRELAAAAMRAGDRLSDAVREERAIGQSGQRVVVRHVDDALVGESSLGNLRFQAGVGARELLGSRLDAPLERSLHLAQRFLANFALAVLAAYDAVSAPHEDEQYRVQHGHDRHDDDDHLPLRPLDLCHERGDVVVDLEHRGDRPVGLEPYGNVGREQVAVLDLAIVGAELVAMRELAGDVALACRLEAGVACSRRRRSGSTRSSTPCDR